MSEILNIKFFWVIFVLSFLFLNPLFAILGIPGIPHQFYGTITFKNGEKVGPGFILKAYVDGEVAGTTYTLDGKYGYKPFLFFVTDPENNREGKLITFRLYDPLTGHTYPIIQSWKFEHGGYTKLDLTVEESYVPLRQEKEKGRGGGGGSGIFYPTTENETRENATVSENKSEFDEILDLIVSNKTEEAREAMLKIEERLAKELEDIYNSKTIIENLSITFDDLSAIGLSFNEYQKALEDLKTAVELMNIAKNTEDLETKLRLINTIELLKEQIKDKIPEIKKVKETSGTVKTTQKEISDALSIATDEKVKSLINDLSGKTSVSVEKQIEVYKMKNKQTGKEIYKSKITIKIKNKNTEIIEIIPKDIVEDAANITFIGPQPEILERDPIVRWVSKSIEKNKIKYIVPAKINKINDTITLAGIENFCGDGICQNNENCSTCEVDCGLCQQETALPTGYTILTNPAALISIIGGILVTILGFLLYKRKLK